MKNLAISTKLAIERNKNIKVIFACRIKNKGDRQKEELFKKLIYRWGIQKNYIFLNYINNIGDYFQISSIGVFTVHRNYPKIDYPVYLLELMYMGKPVITTDLEPYNEIYESKGVLKHKLGDYTDLAAKIISLMDDKKMYSRLSTNAERYVKNNCTNKNIVPIIQSQYYNILREN